MSVMGKYCKAYLLSDLRQYPAWSEKTENIRQDKTAENGPSGEEKRLLLDQDYLFLQENYTVTDGIFLDENVIFDSVTPEWVDYCKDTLKFEIPDLGVNAEATAAAVG